MNLLIATRRLFNNAFGIRSHYLWEQIVKAQLYHYVEIIDVIDVFKRLRSTSRLGIDHVLFLCPANDLKDIIPTLKSDYDVKIFYATASIGIWEQPKWAIDVRSMFDHLFIGCSGPDKIELECCEKLKLPYTYTPFGIDLKPFENIEYGDKWLITTCVDVLLEDSNKGKDDISMYRWLFDRYGSQFFVRYWDRELWFPYGELMQLNEHFIEHCQSYKHPRFYLNGMPRMERAVEEWFPTKQHLKNMAIYDNRILEAMAAGCIVVSRENTIQPDLMKCSWNPSSLNPLISIYFSNDEIYRLYDALKEGNMRYRKEIFERQRNHVGNYSWDIVFEKFWKPSFEKLINE